MRIRHVLCLAPLAFLLACTDEGPIQNTGPKLTITPATITVETGADPITLTAAAENGTLTGNVTWTVLSGNAGTLGTSTGTTNTFTPSDLGTSGGTVQIQAVATVDGSSKPATAVVEVVPSTHGRIAMGVDPGGAVGPTLASSASVAVSDPSAGTAVTFVVTAPTRVHSGIIDAGTYLVTADAGIAVPGSVVDGIWDGTVSFDGGTPVRSLAVAVRPNQETAVAVRFELRGGQGRIWIPANDAIRSFTEDQLLGERSSQNGVGVGDARAAAFDADGNLWATFSDGVRMFTPDVLSSDGSTPAKTITLADATGIAIRGDTVAVASCSQGKVFTFSRTQGVTPSPLISVTCPVGISYDTGNTGKLWVASNAGANKDKVYRYDAGTADTSVSLPGAYGVGIDGNGNVWGSSCSMNFVQQLTPSAGTQITSPDMTCPGGMAFDKVGTLWVLSGTGGNSSNLLFINGTNVSVQLGSLPQITFGGIAFDPAAATLPVHQ
jgi:hypothetical protein